MRRIDRLARVINKTTDFLGKAASYAVIFLVCIATGEVVLRYVFHAPTNWAWEVNAQLYALVGTLAAAYAFHHGYFVNVDVFYRKFSPRIKLLMNTLAFLFAATLCVVLIWQGSEAFLRSLAAHEVYPTYFGSPAYPVKFLIPLGALFLLLGVVAKFVVDLMPPPQEATKEVN